MESGSHSFSPMLGQRAPLEEIERQARLVREYHCSRILDNLPTAVLVLNNFRQAVYANGRMLGWLKLDNPDTLLGHRPGELLKCLFSGEHQGGCGASEYCKGCGALRAILSCLDGQPDQAMVSVLTMGGGLNTRELSVSTSPFTIEEERFVLLFIEDITWRREERELERMFFHDMLNLAGGIKSLIDIVAEEVQPELRDEALIIRENFHVLLDELALQAQLKAARNGELHPEIIPVRPLDILRNVVGLYQAHPLGRGKRMRIESGTMPETIRTDPRIFARVLGNLMKNALEAAPDDSEIVAGCRTEGSGVRFYVENEGVVTRHTQGALFTQSMESSKEGGRGLGLRSVKLFVENYLGGRAAFDGCQDGKVGFSIWLPATPCETVTKVDTVCLEHSLRL